MILIWFVVAIFAVLSILLLMGKGSFLIAGYNTSSQAEKAQYDEKKLCRVMGIGMLIITLLLLVSAIFQFDFPKHFQWVLPVGITIDVVVMIIASNTMCKNKDEDAITNSEQEKSLKSKAGTIATVVIVFLIGAFVCVSMFTGSVEINAGQKDIAIDVSMWSDDKILYKDIESVKYSKNVNLGTRTNGLGNLKIQAGQFNNEKFGNYYLYSNVDCKEYIILKTKYKTVLINDTDGAKTKQLYNQILKQVAET
ncbi:MAG: DUF3784 domain-containing protein [Oscillospiraceae bacterium]